MKKSLSSLFAAIIMISCLLFCSSAVIAAEAETGYLENTILGKFSGKERIELVVSTQPGVSVESQANGSLLIKLENIFVPENLLHSFGENELDNITSVVPAQQSRDGKQWAYLTVEIKEAVPYVVKQEGKNIYIDFNVSAQPENKTRVQAAESPDRSKQVKKEKIVRYTDKLISLDFQDADIKSVLRLMAEYGNMSIVSGDDVKGNVTLTMKNVPWEQALDTILDINGLAKKQMGDVISVLTLERKKKGEGDKVKAEEDQRKAEDERRAREQKLLAEKGLLKQILIEAKIVEATEDFIRNIGVTWGLGNNQSVGSYGLGISAGSSSSQTNTFRQVYNDKILWGTTDVPPKALQMAAVNFPAAVASPTIGLVFGGAAGFLETQLAALESTTSGKLISSPKVVTMEGIKATIKQGDEVPYVTPGSGNSPPTVSFKEALLKLEVTPRTTDEGRISMSIKASNDIPDYAKAALNPQGNPPIRKNEVDSTVVIKDGDTVVIGGILKTQDENLVSGLPWLQKIPALGWLFKTDNTTKQKRQLLIFVTPKILQSSGFSESAEKVIN